MTRWRLLVKAGAVMFLAGLVLLFITVASSTRPCVTGLVPSVQCSESFFASSTALFLIIVLIAGGFIALIAGVVSMRTSQEREKAVARAVCLAKLPIGRH
jgi:hypothetical protein